MTEDRNTPRIVVIGAGAAGMMAAYTAAETLREAGAPEGSVLLIEQNDRPGRKLRITGKGRCNVTNDCDREEFLRHVLTNPRFLYSALSEFDTQDTKAFFEARGVPLKVERGRRVFPVSDRAGDIVDALATACRAAGVRTIAGRVSGLEWAELPSEDSKQPTRAISGVRIGGQTLPADAVILCTGGCSYPVTGSDGNGYRLVEPLGHTIQPPAPSLIPIVCAGDLCRRMMGLSLRNVKLRVTDTQKGNKLLYEDMGEMLFTHFGVTGPLVLTASACLTDMAGLAAGRYRLSIDLKPALDEAALDARIRSDFAKFSNRDFINSLSELLPQKAIQPLAELSGIPLRKKVNTVTREERLALVGLLKNLPLEPISLRPIKEAIVTRGGVTVREVDPRTMQSKLCRGLYFAGEVLDVDATTGGYNLQIAFSTGRLAGQNAAWQA